MKPILEKIHRIENQSFHLERIDKKYFADKWHFHPEIEILLVLEGKGTKYVGDAILPFFPGDLVVVGSNTPHVWDCNPEYSHPESKLMSRAICIQFPVNIFDSTPDSLPEYLKINSFLNEANRGVEIKNTLKNPLTRMIEEMVESNGLKRLIKLITILDIIANHRKIRVLSSPSFNSTPLINSDIDRMEKIFNFVIQNYTGNISLENISSLVSLTPQSFCRYFKSRTGKVFSSYLNDVRIGNSCKLLIEGKLSVSEICYLSGFNYLSNFNRQFKLRKGITPTEFQGKYKNDSFLWEDNYHRKC